MKLNKSLQADGTPRTHTLRKQVVVEYLNVCRLTMKKEEVSGTFPFMCPVSALPIFYHRHRQLNLYTALST